MHAGFRQPAAAVDVACQVARGPRSLAPLQQQQQSTEWDGSHASHLYQHPLPASRPEVPPREELPGPDSATFSGLDAYLQLMEACWAQDPATRPSFEEVVPRLRCGMACIGWCCLAQAADCHRTSHCLQHERVQLRGCMVAANSGR